MNFQSVRNANGSNIDLEAQVIELNGEGVSQKSGKPYKKMTLLDNTGEKHLVTIRGNNIPTAAVIQQTHSFTLSSYQGNANGQPYTGYSGFWNPPSEDYPQKSYHSQNSHQDAPQPAKATNSPLGGDSSDQKCRRDAGLCSAKMVSGKSFINAQDALGYILDIAEPLSKWFITGDIPKLFTSNPNKSGYGVPDISPEEDGIPFP